MASARMDDPAKGYVTIEYMCAERCFTYEILPVRACSNVQKVKFEAQWSLGTAINVDWVPSTNK